jgi:hypothetical protein
MKSSILWDITPCSPLKANRRFGGTCLHLQGQRISQARKQLCLPPAFKLVSCLAHSSILKREATCSSETSVAFQRTTRRYIPHDRTRLLLYYLFYNWALPPVTCSSGISNHTKVSGYLVEMCVSPALLRLYYSYLSIARPLGPIFTVSLFLIFPCFFFNPGRSQMAIKRAQESVVIYTSPYLSPFPLKKPWSQPPLTQATSWCDS